MASRWQQRNERARQLGYRNYYDYRVHRYGAIPADQPAAPRGPEYRRLRGHASLADLERSLERGTMLSATGFERDRETGQWGRIEVTVIDRAGNQTQFRLRGKQAARANLLRFRDRIRELDIVLYGPASIDVFRQL